MATATGAVGEVQSDHVDGNFDTEMVTEEMSSPADKTVYAAVNKTLSWTAPVAREDRLPISTAEISDFRVYYRTKPGTYKQYFEINDAYTNEIDLNVFKLVSGSYSLVLTTIDTDGRESTFSEVILIEV